MPEKTQRLNPVRDLIAGLVVFLVAIPLCLGIAKASGDVPLMSGILAGIVGGIVVGILSGSHTSVSGPAAGLTAVVAAQLASVGSFRALLLATMIAGLIQLAMGIGRLGILAAFVPSSVIKGLLAAIGVILILKQFPHLIGYDKDAEGEMSFLQPDHHNTFSELWYAVQNSHLGPLVVGVVSLVIMVGWDRIGWLKRLPLPSALVAVVSGGFLGCLLSRWGGDWVVAGDHLVRLPEPKSWQELTGLLQHPDWGAVGSPRVWVAGITIALVASLETLLNLEAVDRLDPQRRSSPPNRELVAQGVGNTLCGLIGGLPVTSVIVRSSVNINAGGRTRISAIFHGVLLLFCVLAVPWLLNLIPLSSLAAVLLVTGYKLASPRLFRQLWQRGPDQFLPFVVTLVAIVLTDLLTGILIGLGFSLFFILRGNVVRPLRQIREKHLGGDVLRIELSNQVSFLNRASLRRVLQQLPRGSHLLLDARNTDYLDHDVLEMLHDFETETAPAHGVRVSKTGFREHYAVENRIQFVDYATRELQQAMSPDDVLRILREGNDRFRNGMVLFRIPGRQVEATADGQFPLAAFLGCIDSRTPVEAIFDLGIGEAFSVRIAGNVAGEREIGSLEFACCIAGARLLVVMGHTRCGAVAAAVQLAQASSTAADSFQCPNVDHVLNAIRPSIPSGQAPSRTADPEGFAAWCDEVSRRNVRRMMQLLLERSPAIARLCDEGKIRVVGCLYDVRSGQVEFLDDQMPGTRAPDARGAVAPV